MRKLKIVRIKNKGLLALADSETGEILEGQSRMEIESDPSFNKFAQITVTFELSSGLISGFEEV